MDLERDEIRKAFGGRAWHEVAPQLLASHRQALFFFGPKGWAYFLPAYMSAAIDSYDAVDTVLSEIAATLKPTTDARIEEIREARIAALTFQQQQVVLKFIEWAANEHPEDIDEIDREAIIAGILRQ